LARTDSVSEVIWCVGFRSDGRSDRGNNTHRLGSPERRRWRAPALKLDGGDDAVAPGGDGEVDEERLDAGKTMGSSMCSIVSSGGE
jgi:hypothetical protein